MLLREIMPDDADQRDGFREERGGKGGVGGGTAEQVRALGFRGFHMIDGDGAADGDFRVGSGHGGCGRGAGAL